MQQFTKVKNIYIIGAGSTGKTTLVNALQNALAEQLKPKLSSTSPPMPKVIREVARNVLEEHNYTRDDITDSPSRALELQILIMKAQLAAEIAASRISPSTTWYISDRSGIDPIVYASVFVSNDAAEELLKSDEWIKLKERMKAAVVILCEAGCRWLVDDGVRLMPKSVEDWMTTDSTFRRLLEENDIPYHVISKNQMDIAKRVKYVLDIIGAENETGLPDNNNNNLTLG
jgi:nicotinamide riboside kinase